MTSLRFAAPLTASAVLMLSLFAPGLARAASDCQASSDCDKGFECQEVGSSGCAPTPACAPGQACADAAPCEPMVETSCVPAHCTSDAQCGAGMVCHEWSKGCATSDCACASDQPDCTCPAPACDETVESYCTPQYALPCTAAADCGAGFTCEEQESCGCSGSSGGADASPGAAPQPEPGDAEKPLPPDGEPVPQPDPDCSCQPTGQLACVPKEIECESDAACPTGWSCQDLSPSTSTPACDGDNCDAAPLPEPQPSKRLCAPKYYGSFADDDGVDIGTPTTGNGGGKGTTGGVQNPEASPTDASADSSDSSACQMGHTPASHSALSILALLGAVVGLSRRRAQSRV